MSRRDPGKIVGYVEDKVSKVKTELRLVIDSTEGTVFFARVGEHTTRNKDGDVVRKWIAEQQRAMRHVEWTPIIFVEFSSTDTPSKPWINGREIKSAIVGNIDFRAHRSYIAKVGKAFRELDWADHDEYSDPMARVDESYSFGFDPDLAALPYKVPRERFSHRAAYEMIFAYDDALWAGLNAIVEGMERSRLALKSILRNAGPAAEFLLAVGAGRMAAGALLPGAAIDAETRDEDEEDDDE